MGTAESAASGGDDAIDTTELDPAGVLTRSLDPGTGFIPVDGSQPPQPAMPSRRARRVRPERGRYGWWPGAVAVVAAVALIVVDAVAVSTAGEGSYEAATGLAWAAIALSAIAVLGGLAAVLLGRGRLLGAAAIVLGIGANPYLLTRVLEALGG